VDKYAALIPGGAPQGPLISPHELGHSVGGLQDEYPYSARNVPGGKSTGAEPSSTHHTIQTVQQMDQVAGAHVRGDVVVEGGSLLTTGASAIDGRVKSTGAGALQLIGTSVLGSTDVSGTTGDTTIAGAKRDGGLTLAGNAGTVKLVGNRIYRLLDCSGDVSDYGAPNALGAPKSGTCAALRTTTATASTPVTAPVGGTVAATLSLTLGAPAQFGSSVPGKAADSTAATSASVTSTAGTATLTASDPGRLINGASALPSALTVDMRRARGAGRCRTHRPRSRSSSTSTPTTRSARGRTRRR
jgi:hypothetical protein